ncbi:MAG: NAD-dependent epimerase/dehydratase family protein [Lachnospiraceae bacterium]|nr:NAD-dependent epimerase/dehydratase family protein [Lachnospiraceae bacterium]
MKRVYLITGAAGHLASTTIKKLVIKECRIRGLILPNENGVDDEQITYYRGDVTKPDTLDEFFSGLDKYEVIVLHMAAIISIQDKVSETVYNVNVNGTKNVVDKCLKYHVKRLIYVSSVHAIPEPDKITTIEEIQHFSKDAVEGAYAVTKAEATQVVLDAKKRGLDVVVVHPSGITGPGDLGNNHMTQLMQMYLHHKLPMGVSGGYDFVDVRDVADGILAAVDNGRNGECYLLSNRYVSIPELLECMRMATGRQLHKGCCPLWIAKAVAPVAEFISRLTKTRPIFTKYSLKTMEANGHFCHDKATMELGYHPRDIKITVKDTMKYLQANNA